MSRRTCVGLWALIGLFNGVLSAHGEVEAGKDSGKAGGGAPILTLPTKYDADRFFAVPSTGNGLQLELLVATGDRSMIYSDAARTFGSPISRGVSGSTILLPPFDPDRAIPSPHSGDGYILIKHARYRRSYLPDSCSGILGESWFGGGVWTFDYPGKKLQLRPVGALPDVDRKHRVSLTFRTSGLRTRDNNLPRLDIRVAGERLSMLLDTGATTTLEAKALKRLDDKGDPLRGMSFVKKSTLRAWRDAHAWRVIESAEKDSGAALIVVPRIEVAGHAVGPVWFVARSDAYLINDVSRELDKRIDGILGGNALKYFRMTLDYPSGEARFERP